MWTAEVTVSRNSESIVKQTVSMMRWMYSFPPCSLNLKEELIPQTWAESRKSSYGLRECVWVNRACSSVTQGQNRDKEGADSNLNGQNYDIASAVIKAIHHNICQSNTIRENRGQKRGLTPFETIIKANKCSCWREPAKKNAFYAFERGLHISRTHSICLSKLRWCWLCITSHII